MYYIGVDVGGTNLAAGVVNEEGHLLAKASVPTGRERSHEEIFKDIAELCIKLLKSNEIDEKDVAYIGLGIPGAVNVETGVIGQVPNANIGNVDAGAEIKKHLNIPVYIDNDANCAALGESVSGSAKGVKNSITVTLGTGVGGGIIIDNKIYSGSFSGGGEIGHHVICVGGQQCGCGRKGCYEAYASASALIREAKRLAKENPSSEINKLTDGDLSKVNAKIPFDAADRGDELAAQLIDDYLTYVAEGLANLINIFMPDIVAIGGGVCAQGDRIVHPITEKVKKRVFGEILNTRIVTASLGNDAGIIGAAFLKKGL